MKRKLLLFSLVFLLVSSLFTISIGNVQASVTIQEKTGKLGGANYIVQIPSNWNGRLIVCCRGYSPWLEGVDLRFYANAFKPLVEAGFAFAVSDLGSGGYCIKDGVIRTHQLTEYVINNFQVTGKTYLVGISMGGNIALMLGAKYPDLYAGVLEFAGTKDVAVRYALHSYYAGIADDAELGAAVVANGGVNPPAPCPTIDYFRGYCICSVANLTSECGGTPQDKPQAYDRISPIDSATKIAIPTITIHGTKDALAPYTQSVDYMNAVTAAGHANLYRLYKVDGAQHCDAPVMAQMGSKLTLLIGWAEYGAVPPPSTF